MRKLPVEADLPQCLIEVGMMDGATEKEKVMGDSALLAYYYLLRIGEYMLRKDAQPTARFAKQTEQLKMKDVTFFATHSQGRLYQVPHKARDLL